MQMSKRLGLLIVATILAIGMLGLLWWRDSNYNAQAAKVWPISRLPEREKVELNRRAQTLYGRPDYTVHFEMKNSLFTRMFPRSRMYAVWRDYHTQPRSGEYETMVSYRNVDYRMPEQFNQLMFDAGYELTCSTRDELAYALIIAALPQPLIVEPVTCQKGMKIYVEREPFPPGTYEIHCHVTSDNYDIVVRFTDCSTQFQGGSMSVSDESENEMFGYNFGISRALMEKE